MKAYRILRGDDLVEPGDHVELLITVVRWRRAGCTCAPLGFVVTPHPDWPGSIVVNVAHDETCPTATIETDLEVAPR